MAQYITKIRTESGDMQIDYKSLANLPPVPTLESLGAASYQHTHKPEAIGAAPKEHEHSVSEITDFPTSLPANGGNADTLGGKPVGDFALSAEVELLQTQVDNMTLESFDVTATSTELNHLEGVTDNVQEQLNKKSDLGHAHDDKYYTETEVDALLANKANTFESGVTILSSHQYGDELPSPGIVGRWYLKKVKI